MKRQAKVQSRDAQPATYLKIYITYGSPALKKLCVYRMETAPNRDVWKQNRCIAKKLKRIFNPLVALTHENRRSAAGKAKSLCIPGAERSNATHAIALLRASVFIKQVYFQVSKIIRQTGDTRLWRKLRAAWRDPRIFGEGSVELPVAFPMSRTCWQAVAAFHQSPHGSKTGWHLTELWPSAADALRWWQRWRFLANEGCWRPA